MNYLNLKSRINHDEYVQYVYDKLDVQPSEYREVLIPYDLDGVNTFEWNIGLICGNSGSGKTSLINAIGGGVKLPTYTDECVISQFKQFGMSPEMASDILFNVGLSSIPTWLSKPNQLSNGEKARLDIAMQLANAKDGETIYIDEWTSVVNREVAKAMSNSIQKLIRKKNLKVVFVSCHFDIIDWLQCDWIYNLNNIPTTLERMCYSDSEEYKFRKDICDDVILSKELSI